MHAEPTYRHAEAKARAMSLTVAPRAVSVRRILCMVGICHDRVDDSGSWRLPPPLVRHTFLRRVLGTNSCAVLVGAAVAE
jgi:hypothetical protein